MDSDSLPRVAAYLSRRPRDIDRLIIRQQSYFKCAALKGTNFDLAVRAIEKRQHRTPRRRN